MVKSATFRRRERVMQSSIVKQKRKKKVTDWKEKRIGWGHFIKQMRTI